VRIIRRFTSAARFSQSAAKHGEGWREPAVLFRGCGAMTVQAAKPMKRSYNI
jgi:hypothetical protein